MTSPSLFQASASIPLQRAAQTVADTTVSDATGRVEDLLAQGSESFAVFVVGAVEPVDDAVAAAVSRRMRQVLSSFVGAWRGLRPSVARVEQGRFLVTIEQIPTMLDATAFAEVMLLESSHVTEGQDTVPLSVGVATPATSDAADGIIQAAQDAFCAARRLGEGSLSLAA